MTNTYEFFSIYVPCSSNKKIVIADCSLNTIAGKGNIKFNPTLILENVLHISKLCTNLVPVSKLSQDLNCKITFHYSHCDIENQNSVKMIGRVEAKHRFYFLDILKRIYSIITTDTIHENWLHHRRSAH